jgi:hypothetical protein
MAIAVHRIEPALAVVAAQPRGRIVAREVLVAEEPLLVETLTLGGER